ncbi:hypothetical protein RSAG8_11195, partial [Rhizoctonia solani AG-8 WAC10335]
MPSYLETSEHAIQARSKTGDTVPLREIIEEYRITSTFDIFASIGGLLALLQGIHILLFGRPLFWGMFGTKLITPFGLTGRLATKGFKQRLKERYHYPPQPNQAEPWQVTTRPRAAVDVDMTQFLLDFVVDMGPASAPNLNREETNSDISDSEDESQYKPVQRLEDVEEGRDAVKLEWRRASFKQRLKERYHYPPQPPNQAEPWQVTTRPRAAADVDMTQFLLDFAVDMGPASAPNSNREEINSDISDSEDESQYKPVQSLEDVEEGGRYRGIRMEFK